MHGLRPYVYRKHNAFSTATTDSSPGDNPSELGTAVKKKHKNQAKWPRVVIYLCTRALHSYLSVIHFYPPSSLCCPRAPSHHPSNLTLDYPVRVRFCYRHQHPSRHGVHIHSLHMPKPSKYSDSLYSPTPFLFKLFYAPLHS